MALIADFPATSEVMLNVDYWQPVETTERTAVASVAHKTFYNWLELWPVQQLLGQ